MTLTDGSEHRRPPSLASKIRLLPLPQKFNTFNTFNTFNMFDFSVNRDPLTAAR